MKALLCGPYPYPNESIWGGVQAVLKNLKSGFNRYEPGVSLKVLSSSNRVRNLYEIYDDVIYIKEPRLKLGSVFISSYPFRVKKILNKTEFDILNTHLFYFGYYGLKLKDRLEDKLLFTLHGIIWEEKKFKPLYNQPFWDFFYMRPLEKLLKRLKYFVSINPYVREVIKDKISATIFDIPNPVPNKYFEIKDNTQEKRMFYIGVISKRKNLLTLIKALNLVKSEIKDFKLIVAGKIGDKNYFNQVISYINKHNLNDNVRYLGRITDKQKYEEFSKMSFLVLPSLQETAPMVISEAFAAAKPVVASDICGIPYMIESEKNGLTTDPQNENDIANKIIYLIENPKNAESMGRNARKYAEKYHRLDVVVRKYKRAYEIITDGY